MNAETKIEPPENANLAIWNALSKTDPKHTKPFSRAGGFKGTALKPIWIVKMLTEQFGPCGEGWGMNKPDFQIVHGDGDVLVYCTVECWHTEPANTFVGVGGDKVIAKRKDGGLFHDDEAFKKAFTDAVGNAFKFLGVGADVHMGQFDDSKYVAAVAKEFAERAAEHVQAADPPPSPDEPAKGERLEGKHPVKTKLQAALKEYHAKLQQTETERELDALVKDYAGDLEQGVRYLPKWMNGDPDKDSKGLIRTTDERREFLQLLDQMRLNRTQVALDRWRGEFEEEIEKLDGLEGRQFEHAFEQHVDAIKLVETVRA